VIQKCGFFSIYNACFYQASFADDFAPIVHAKNIKNSKIHDPPNTKPTIRTNTTNSPVEPSATGIKMKSSGQGVILH